MRKMAYQGTQVVILGFDMTNKDSLQNIVAPKDKCWVSEVREKCKDMDDWILVGTKHDLWEKNGGVSEEDIYQVLWLQKCWSDGAARWLRKCVRVQSSTHLRTTRRAVW